MGRKVVPLAWVAVRHGEDALQEHRQRSPVLLRDSRRRTALDATEGTDRQGRISDPPDVAQAEAHYQQALALATERGMRPLQAHCHRGLGTLYAVTGQREQARTALSTAIEMYTSMEMMFWLPQTAAALAQVEGR
jgi:hypothetical protein